MKRNIIKRGMFAVFLFISASLAVADTLPEDPSRGKLLFVKKGCVKCHDVEGRGSKIGPDLVTKDMGGTPLDLAARLWNHTPSMVLGMEGTSMVRPALTGQEFRGLRFWPRWLRRSRAFPS